LQKNNLRPESPMKALMSLPVLLAVLSCVLFGYTATVPDRALLSGSAPDKPGLDTVEVLKEARTLSPWKLMEKRNLVAAVKAAQVMLETNPNDVASAYCAAMVFKKSNCQADAFAQMRQALSLAPRNRELRLEYARMLVEEDKIDDAIVQYHWVIKRSPRLPGPRMEIAQLYLNLDRPADCAAELEEYLALVPGDSAVRKIRGIALARAGKPQEGLDEYMSALSGERGGGQTEAVKLILGTLGSNIDRDKFALEQEAAREADNYLPRLKLANLALYNGHPHEAITYLVEARKLAPYVPEIHRLLCIAYKREGDNSKALASFIQSVALEQEQGKKKKAR
jgi:Tfp pilus assembly protein PilF